MKSLEFYEVVRILDTPRTRDLKVVGRTGIVVGLPPHLLGLEDDGGTTNEADPGSAQYGVTIDSEGFALYRRELESTGERVQREALYDGSHIRVSVKGELVDEDSARTGSSRRGGDEPV